MIVQLNLRYKAVPCVWSTRLSARHLPHSCAHITGHLARVGARPQQRAQDVDAIAWRSAGDGRRGRAIAADIA
eukprot:6188994-Pleurochrysis_carterae.AAC.2